MAQQMKKIPLFLSIIILTATLTGCQGFKKYIPFIQETGKPGFAGLPQYTGNKARVFVGDFDIKSAKATSESAIGLRQMFIDALAQSNRFSLAEKNSASIIIFVAVVDFEPQYSGGIAGVGGGGGANSGAMGGLMGSGLNKSRLSLEIRIADAATSTVLASTILLGQADSISKPDRRLSGLPLPKQLSAYVNTPMEKAINVCVIEAIRYLYQVVPKEYYK